jgi:hypothetical protein
MMDRISHRAADLASEFWSEAEKLFPNASALVPRRLDNAIPAALPVAIVMLSSLSVLGVSSWMRRARGVFLVTPAPDRPLRGCLVAFRGNGIIFADRDDAAGEIQLTLAHEAAHFICHYVLPRRRAVERLGPSILEVLDGHRSPRKEELLAGVLRECPIGEYRHLIERNGTAKGAVEREETEADLLGLELLAPAKAVAAKCRDDAGRIKQLNLLHVLEQQYQIPAWGARVQANIIMSKYGHRESRWLKGLRETARTNNR